MFHFTSGDKMVDTVGINETTEWNLLKIILNASYSTFFKMSSARAETWNNKQQNMNERLYTNMRINL